MRLALRVSISNLGMIEPVILSADNIVTRKGHGPVRNVVFLLPLETLWRKSRKFSFSSWKADKHSAICSNIHAAFWLVRRRHIRAVHEDIRPFPCPYCTSFFKKRGAFEYWNIFQSATCLSMHCKIMMTYCNVSKANFMSCFTYV